MSSIEWDGIERRTSRLRKEDVDAIVEGVTESLSNHFCRFNKIKTEDMEAVIPFMLSFKGLTEKTGVWIWKIIITMVVAGLISLAGMGFWYRLGK